MTIELKTGKKGELHISSEDDRLLHCRSFGTGTYVLSGCTVTMTSANKAHIAEGELMVQGGYVRITGGGEDVAISNGVAGQKRNTIIALEYTRDSNGIEAMSFVSVDGASTTETPSDPTVTTNNINTGASSSAWKFARIQLNGLTVGTPQVLFTTKTAALLDQISSLSSQVTSLQDSVSQEVVDGWQVLKIGNLAICRKAKQYTGLTPSRESGFANNSLSYGKVTITETLPYPLKDTATSVALAERDGFIAGSGNLDSGQKTNVITNIFLANNTASSIWLNWIVYGTIA